MTEILLLGSFHFLESNIDFYSADIQKQIQKICVPLMRFQPDKIAIEAPASSQDDVNASYEILKLDNFNDPEVMRTTDLGKITIFGCDYRVTYNNEAVQIGYRVAKLLCHRKIFAVDDDTVLDDSALKYLNSDQKSKYNDLLLKMKYTGNPDDLIELYNFCNSRKWSLYNHQLYLTANAVNIGNSYNGTEYVSNWYKRNLRIFSNIQNLCSDCNKLLVIYGAGHLEILRQLIIDCDNLKLINYEFK